MWGYQITSEELNNLKTHLVSATYFEIITKFFQVIELYKHKLKSLISRPFYNERIYTLYK